MKDSISRNAELAGLCAVILFCILSRGAVRLWSVSIALAGISTIMLISLLRISTAGRNTVRTDMDLPIVLLVIIGFLSALFSIYKYVSVAGLFVLLSYVGLYYAAVNDIDRLLRRGFIFFIITTGALLSLYGFLQYIGVFPHGWWVPQGMLAATFVNHNHFAGYLELAIPVAFSLLYKYQFDASDPRIIIKRIALTVSLILMISAFVLTQSRGAWTCLVLSLLIVGILFIKRKEMPKKGIIVFIMACAVLALYAYFAGDLVLGRFGEFTETGVASAGTRLKIWEGAAGLIKENPVVGSGIGTFSYAFGRFRPEGLYVKANFAHNDYIEMAAEMGLLAPVIFIIIIAAAVKKGIRDGMADPVKLGLSAAVLSLALHNIVDFNFHIPANMIVFIVYIALLMRRTAQ